MELEISAVYHNGVFEPENAANLPEGTRAKVIVHLTAPQPDTEVGQREALAQLLAGLDSVEEEGLPGPFSGTDHDSVLYPKQ